MKKTTLLFILLLVSLLLLSQNQSINGDLQVNGSLTTKVDLIVGEHVPEKNGYGSKLYLQGVKGNTDPVWMAKYVRGVDSTDLRVNVGDGLSVGDRYIVGTTSWDTAKWYDLFVVRMDGNVGIGVSDPTCALDVKGQIKGNKLDIMGIIRAKEVKIEATGWSDFVFDKDYKLPTLKEVEDHINKKGTLPDIPSEQEVLKNGIDVGEMQTKLLQKIEELTLYVIELKKENEAQDALIKKLLDKRGE